MKSIISLFIFFSMFNQSHAADENCSQILNADGNWMITYNATVEAIKSNCDLNQLKKCDQVLRLGPMPAITCAIESTQINAMKTMIDAKVDLNAKDQSGLTPLMHSIGASESAGSFPKALITSGADLNATDNSNRTAMDYAHLARNTKVEVEIVKVDFDKKNPCSFSYESLSSYYFIAQTETTEGDPSDINAVALPGSLKALGTAYGAGYVVGHAKREWKPFMDKIKPYTNESYYLSNCSYTKKQSGGNSPKNAKALK